VTHTVDTLAALLATRQESDLPDQLLDALRPLQGKAITTRLLDQLPGGKAEWTLSREYGWTHLVSRVYYRTSGREGLRIMLARTEASVPLDLAWVETENGAYFGARRQRNADRLAARQDVDLLNSLAAALNQVASLQGQLAEAQAVLDALTEHGTVLDGDRYEIHALVNGGAK
jgi:hypothetical protein